MLTVEKLREYGANVDEGLGRCLNNEEFYLRMVKKELADVNFEKLAAAVGEGNARSAFEAAHAIKGAVGNLALTPIFEPVCELTELLRGKTELPDVGELPEIIADRFGKLKALAE